MLIGSVWPSVFVLFSLEHIETLQTLIGDSASAEIVIRMEIKIDVCWSCTCIDLSCDKIDIALATVPALNIATCIECSGTFLRSLENMPE